MIARLFALCLLAGLTACPSKQTQPVAGKVDKDGIQRRSDAVHEDVNKEEKKDEERKENQ